MEFIYDCPWITKTSIPKKQESKEEIISADMVLHVHTICTLWLWLMDGLLWGKSENTSENSKGKIVMYFISISSLLTTL